MFNFITYETKDPADLLNQLKIGSATKRWQSAFELSKVLNDPNRVPEDISFKNQMISAYQYSINDDPLVRSYLAIAMGVSRDPFYENELLKGLDDENRESRLAAIQSIGMVGSSKSLSNLEKVINPMGWLAMGSADPKPPRPWKMHVISNAIFWQFIG